MKCCARCTRWKSSADFYADRRPGRSRDGLHHNCKDCERDSARSRARASYQVKGTMIQPRDADGRFLYAGRRAVA